MTAREWRIVADKSRMKLLPCMALAAGQTPPSPTMPTFRVTVRW